MASRVEKGYGLFVLSTPKVSPAVSGPSAALAPAQPSGFLDRVLSIQFSKILTKFRSPLVA